VQRRYTVTDLSCPWLFTRCRAPRDRILDTVLLVERERTPTVDRADLLAPGRDQPRVASREIVEQRALQVVHWIELVVVLASPRRSLVATGGSSPSPLASISTSTAWSSASALAAERAVALMDAAAVLMLTSRLVTAAALHAPRTRAHLSLGPAEARVRSRLATP
jgi:hypothetical protein